jgi:carbonic anhydrase/acetyltransferase-like protein (isoleucine patch superfamily)
VVDGADPIGSCRIHGDVEIDAAADVWWDTTIQGNALAMAGFG